MNAIPAHVPNGRSEAGKRSVAGSGADKMVYSAFHASPLAGPPYRAFVAVGEGGGWPGAREIVCGEPLRVVAVIASASEMYCHRDVGTDGVRKATRSRASESPWPGEGATPEQPGQSEKCRRRWVLPNEEQCCDW